MVKQVARSCQAVERLIENMKDAERLIEIHENITGDRPGRRWGMAVLNHSGVVLITAFWEAFIEDLAEEAFDFLLTQANGPNAVPKKVRALSTKPLIKENGDTAAVWSLAGDGWRSVLKDHRGELMKRYVGSFNTPKPDSIDALFEGLIGLRRLSACWKWQGQSVDQARNNLIRHINDRGAIAHRGRTEDPIVKDYVLRYRDFVFKLAVKSTNQVAAHLRTVTGKRPWLSYQVGSVS